MWLRGVGAMQWLACTVVGSWSGQFDICVTPRVRRWWVARSPKWVWHSMLLQTLLPSLLRLGTCIACMENRERGAWHPEIKLKRVAITLPSECLLFRWRWTEADVDMFSMFRWTGASQRGALAALQTKESHMAVECCNIYNFSWCRTWKEEEDSVRRIPTRNLS